MDNFKMDRSFVSKLTFEEADDHVTFYKNKTPLERLNTACFIINNVFQVTPETKIDKTKVTKRKHVQPI